MPEPDYARIAYEAYAKHQGWRDFHGVPLPRWEELLQHIRDGFEAAIDAAFNAQRPGDIPKPKAKRGSKASY